MPKPFLIRRPSGLYARFLLPADMRERVGSRFLVRSLAHERGDRARLTAAHLGYALSQAIQMVRRGGAGMGPKDTKKLIEDAMAAAAKGGTRPYDLNIPGVISLRAENAADHALAMDALERVGTWAELGLRLPAAPPMPSGPMLHASIERFLKDFAATGRAAATRLETEHSLTLFRDLIDDVPVGQLGAEHIDGFRDALAAWPARARVLPAFKGLPARAIVAKAKSLNVPRLTVRTVEKHLDRLRVFFNSLVQRGELARNPLSGLRLQTQAAKYEPKRRGFTPEELMVLFEPERRAEHASDDPMKFWLPVLMLYTGARLNELVYLDAQDFDCIDGVWGFHITKHLKTPQSKRYLPLPQRVLDLGLQKYAQDIRAAGFKHLFPGGSEEAKNGRGDTVSKWFNRTFLRKACGITDPEVCFQSCRNTLTTAADRCGISEAQMNPILGHGPRSLQQKHYIDPPTLPERAQRVERLAAHFDLPPLVAYRSGQFSAYVAELLRKERRVKAVAARAARQR